MLKGQFSRKIDMFVANSCQIRVCLGMKVCCQEKTASARSARNSFAKIITRDGSKFWIYCISGVLVRLLVISGASGHTVIIKNVIFPSSGTKLSSVSFKLTSK